jgi:hypothetical protein
LVIDFMNVVQFFIDITWAGTGMIRFGITKGGSMIICHTMTTDAPYPSLRSATLPVRYEIEKTSSHTNRAEMRAVCASVSIETGQLYFPIRYSIGISSTTGGSFVGKTMGIAQGSMVVIMSARVAPWNCRAAIHTTSMGIYTSDASNLEYRLILNATLSGPSWTDYLGTGMEYDTSATDATGGICVVTGLSSGSLRVDDSRTDHVRARITSNYQGVPDTMTLVAYNLSAATTKTYKVFGTIQVLMDRE